MPAFDLDVIHSVESVSLYHVTALAAAFRFIRTTGAPIARLKPIDNGDRMRILYWSYRKRWDEAGPLGGIILPLDNALEFIARDPVFWNWT